MNETQTHGAPRLAPTTRTGTIAERRNLGAFYTPSSVADLMCDWAIRRPSDLILEPSFGGCTFLDSSIRRIKQLGQKVAFSLYGCDIDPKAFEILESKAQSLIWENFDLCDFLRWDGSKLSGEKFDVVVGNPPYVRYSSLTKDNQETVHWWEKKYQKRISRRASLWTYFTYHALSFLREGGRMAWVLPVSLMTSRYADELRGLLSERFQRIAYFTVAERIFLSEGTEERALIVLAEGFCLNSTISETTTKYVESVLSLKDHIEEWTRGEKYQTTRSPAKLLKSGLPSDIFGLIAPPERWTTLGQIADIGIGVVSGDSRYFIKSMSEWKSEGIRLEHLEYIAPKSRWITGLALTESDKASHSAGEPRCLALRPPKNPKAGALRKYLDKYPLERIQANATFRKREQWFRFLENRQPHAFAAFMTHLGPRLIVNEVAADGTNSLYRVSFKNHSSKIVKLAAISMQTSPTQLAAERIGRALGSGALKLEPRHMKMLPLYLPELTSTAVDIAFLAIDKAMRLGRADEARLLADKLIFGASTDTKSNLEKVRETLRQARAHRHRNQAHRGINE